jgi:DNA-binding NtrC family response regulator
MTWKVVLGSAGSQHAGSRATSPQPQAKEPMALGKQVRVLVVDDEPSICKALTMALSRGGYEAIAAQSGESALSIIRNEHIDVMLIDLRIPDMRGDVIFEVAAGHQPHLRYQTLFMTGDITERAHKLIAACKCHFLRKPFDLRDMTDAISALSPRVQDAAG